MFLDKSYVLANELVQKMGIHIANISMLRNTFEDQGDSYTIRKMNNCNFIKTNSNKLPNNIRKGIQEHEFTDMSNKLPRTWVYSEYDIKKTELMDAGILVGETTVAGKQFFVFSEDWVNTVKKKIVYVLNHAETMECMERNQILGYVHAGKDKYLTWY